MSGDEIGSFNSTQQPETTAAVAPPPDVPAGSLYVARGAITARAVAGAIAARDPRRKAYLRHVLLTAIVFVCVGVGIAIALTALLK